MALNIYIYICLPQRISLFNPKATGIDGLVNWAATIPALFYVRTTIFISLVSVLFLITFTSKSASSHSYYNHYTTFLQQIDRWGRRPSLISGALLMALCMAALAGIFGIHGRAGNLAEGFLTDSRASTNATIVLCYIFISAFAYSW